MLQVTLDNSSVLRKEIQTPKKYRLQIMSDVRVKYKRLLSYSKMTLKLSQIKIMCWDWLSLNNSITKQKLFHSLSQFISTFLEKFSIWNLSFSMFMVSDVMQSFFRQENLKNEIPTYVFLYCSIVLVSDLQCFCKLCKYTRKKMFKPVYLDTRKGSLCPFNQTST